MWLFQDRRQPKCFFFLFFFVVASFHDVYNVVGLLDLYCCPLYRGKKVHCQEALKPHYHLETLKVDAELDVTGRTKAIRT